MAGHCCSDPGMCTFSDGCCEEGCICREGLCALCLDEIEVGDYCPDCEPTESS